MFSKTQQAFIRSSAAIAEYKALSLRWADSNDDPFPAECARVAAEIATRVVMAQADAVAIWLAELPFPGPSAPRVIRPKTPYRPISDRDVARSGAV